MDYLSGTFISTAFGTTSTNPIEKQIRPLLFDDTIHVLSSFELNQIASLTYNDITCDQIFDIVERITSKPLDHTPLTIQKALVVTKHILIYGQEKVVNHTYCLQDYFRALTNFNTVLMAQKQGGAMAFFQSIQGGGVDKGGPIRDVASDLMKLLSNINELQRIRNASASQDSLVPIGNNQEVAFVTDEVRHIVLKRKIEDQRQIQIKSNLAKADNGFGAGYASQDGKSVVGAAHGIEEMIKMANIQKRKFTDDNNSSEYKTQEELILEELQAEYEAAKAAAAPSTSEGDLLGSFEPSPSLTSKMREVDLLGFGDNNTTTQNTNSQGVGDLLGGGFGTITSSQNSSLINDPFGLTSTNAGNNTSNSGSLLDLQYNTTSRVDPFASISAPSPMIGSNGMGIGNNNVGLMAMAGTAAPTWNNSDVSSLASGMTTMKLGSDTSTTSMTAKEDRFAALDALSISNQSTTVSTMIDAQTAEDRIMNLVTGSSSSISAAPLTGTSSESMSSYGHGMQMGMPPAAPPIIPEGMIAPGRGQVAKAYGDVGDNDNEDSPWVMGGTTGSGLQPIGPAPGAPPPPPPPAF